LLVEAATLLDGLNAATARMQGNLTAAVASWSPIPVDATETVVDAIGVSVVDLWRVADPARAVSA
jgi:hypothetical protein